jgi:hypothetical protein
MGSAPLSTLLVAPGLERVGGEGGEEEREREEWEKEGEYLVRELRALSNNHSVGL